MPVGAQEHSSRGLLPNGLSAPCHLSNGLNYRCRPRSRLRRLLKATMFCIRQSDMFAGRTARGGVSV